MNISRVLKYLISGIGIGAILFFAGFGVMNMLDKSSEEMIQVAKPEITEPENTAVITPPEIEVNPTNSVAQNGEGTSSSPIKIKPLSSEETSEEDPAGESIAVSEEDTKTKTFGTLTLSTINTNNSQPTAADFMIENSDGVAIALVKNTASSTMSLPAGNYKITVTQGQARLVRFLGVKEGKNGAEVFELDVPVVAGGVTAPATDTAIEKPGSTDLATQDAKADGAGRPATEASGEVTVANKDSDTGMGGLRVSALTKEGNRPTNASFYIQKLNGENIQNVKGVSTQQFNLPAGEYRVTARKGAARVVSEIKVIANRGLHEVFHIPEAPEVAVPAPAPTPASNTTVNSIATQRPAAQPRPVTPPKLVEERKPAKPRPTNAVAEKPPAKPRPAATPERPASSASNNQADKTGRLELFSQTATNNKAIKANFYIQTTSGKLVTNKTYVNSIGYKLPTGKYKVTVRASGYHDKTVQLIVREGQVRREVFKLQPRNRAAARPAAPVVPAPPPRQQAPVARAPVSQGRAARIGGLQVNIVSAETGQGLLADISVHRPNGREVRRANRASSARFDLAPREFVIRVNYGGLVTNQKVAVRAGKLAIKTITFR